MLTVRFGLTLVMAMLVSANVGCGCGKAKTDFVSGISGLAIT